ncbi:MAG TPA: hypothetical protein VGN44_00885 [Candidatus Angelobacter sp.]|jgi:hypothetical protein
MSKRGTLRRKVVLPVTVILRNGEEKQLAHTLDITETSARLGGLSSLLEPGEIIEVQRGGVRAKFEVHWMGEPTSTLSGQAGIRGVDPNKSIWGIQLPADEPDTATSARALSGTGLSRGLSIATANSEPHPRYECNGGATLLAPGSTYPVRVQLKNIHVGGFYVESTTTLPVKTIVTIDAKLDGIQVETLGVVNSITPRIGMEIAFHKISAESQRKVLQALQKLKQQLWDAQQVPALAVVRGPVPVPQAENTPETTAQPPKSDACRILVHICQTLAADFEVWKSARSVSEIAELRKAVTELHKKLSTVTQLEEMEFLAVNLPAGRA